MDSKRLGTEASDPRYANLDEWPLARTLAEIVASNERAVKAVGEALPELEKVADALVNRLAAGGRIVYVGAGTSGRVAVQDAAELPPTFGFDSTVVLLAGGSAAGERAQEGAEDDAEAARRDVAAASVDDRDVVIGIAASGRTPFTVAALVEARRRGALTAAIANNPGTPLLEVADVAVLLDTGPEVLAGSTRLAAGTAQKVALNALTTAALVRMGGAFGNLMVGMAPSNRKLRIRAAATVQAATGAPKELVEETLGLTGGSIRTAIVVLRAGVSVPEAREALERNGGRVRDALRSLGHD